MIPINPDTDVAATGLQSGLGMGTEVLTLAGTLPIEHLTPGDRIITRDCGMAVLQELRVHTAPGMAYSIRPDVLGRGRPETPVTMLANQRILLRDWRAVALFGYKEALVPVSRLADGHYISPQDTTELRFFEMIFTEPHILYAGGLELAANGQDARREGMLADLQARD